MVKLSANLVLNFAPRKKYFIRLEFLYKNFPKKTKI